MKRLRHAIASTSGMPFAKRAFTLVELMVSLAVLAVALSVVGVVFAITTQTVTEAAAISETSALVRQFMLQLEEDLKGIDTTHSVLILGGRKQAAALNGDDRAAGVFHRVLVGSHDPNDQRLQGYDPRTSPSLDNNTPPLYSNPRADVLGFFTTRPTVSQAPPRNPSNAQGQALARGTKYSPSFVVYGHAAVDDALLSGNTWPINNNLTHIQPANDDPAQLSPLPLTGWHLARRATIILNQAVSNLTIASGVPGGFTTLQRCYSPPPQDSVAADAAVMNFDAYLESATGLIARASPYDMPPAQVTFFGHEMLYGVNSGPTITKRHVATVLPEPPAELRDNLGVHMLPACAWFEVEFLMPEDVRNSPDYIDMRVPPGDPTANRRDDMPLWTSVVPGATYVFVPDNATNRDRIAEQFLATGPVITPPRPFTSMKGPLPLVPGETPLTHRRIRTWPYAIRVTVRVYDERNRLSSPIVRSMVHRFD